MADIGSKNAHLFFFWPAKFRPQNVPDTLHITHNYLDINNISYFNIFCIGK